MTGKSLEPALRDIIDAIDHIHRKLDGVTLEAFEADLDRRRIVERNIEIISEASRRLPDDLKGRYPDIPWQKVAGIGNILRHDYDAVSHTNNSCSGADRLLLRQLDRGDEPRTDPGADITQTLISARPGAIPKRHLPTPSISPPPPT